MRNHQPRQELEIAPHIKDRLSPLKLQGVIFGSMYDFYIGKSRIHTTKKKKVGKESRFVVHWQAQERRGERASAAI